MTNIREGAASQKEPASQIKARAQLAQLLRSPGCGSNVYNHEIFVFKQHVATLPIREVRVLADWHQRLTRSKNAGANP